MKVIFKAPEIETVWIKEALKAGLYIGCKRVMGKDIIVCSGDRYYTVAENLLTTSSRMSQGALIELLDSEYYNKGETVAFKTLNELLNWWKS